MKEKIMLIYQCDRCDPSNPCLISAQHDTGGDPNDPTCCPFSGGASNWTIVTKIKPKEDKENG